MADPTARLRVTWVKSAIGYSGTQKRTITALGLRRLHQTVEHADTPSVRGMVEAVRHLVRVEEASPGGGAAKP
ncbi:MAG: 50S ribosomal protein L30 [Candidatus Dormibacteria bacterium]